MISGILNALERGLQVMRSNSRMMLVGVLVFVFPLMFVWITQSFFTTAQNNIDFAEKSKVSILHDSIVVSIQNNENYGPVVKSLIDYYIKDNRDIEKIRIVDKDENGFLILISDDESLVGTYEKTDSPYRSIPSSASEGSFIFKATIDGVRTWQVFRRVDLPNNELYIFSEHRFGLADSIMLDRRQDSYLGLTGIFAFLILLAYWINRQTYWEGLHNKLADEITEKDLFFNMVVHEFRSPLTAIKGYASFLEESKTLSKDEIRFSGNIKNAAERLVVLVSDFLEISRLQSGNIKIDIKELDVRDVIAQVVEDLNVLALEKNLKLSYERGLKPVILNTDPARMTQVLTNIITNAIKYTESGGVELECTQIPGEVIVRIKDTGMGISAEDQQKLFAPFTRVGGVDGTSIKGTGLGMWITKKLVTILGGSIGVESIKGIGTHIVIRFIT